MADALLPSRFRTTSAAPSLRADEAGWWALGLLGILAVLGYATADGLVARDTIYLLVGATSCGAIALGVRLHSPAVTRPWLLIGLGQLMFVLGDAATTVVEDVLGSTRFPSVADVFYLAAYPLLTAGLWLLVRSRRARLDVPGLINALTVTAGLGLLSWVVLAQPTADRSADSLVGAVTAVAYPVGDIFLVGALVLLMTTAGGNTRALRLLLAAVGLLIVADSIYVVGDLYGGGSQTLVDLLFLASYLALGMAALHPSMARLSRRTRDSEQNLRRSRLVTLVVATLVAPSVLGVQSLLGVEMAVWPVVIASVVMFLLVVTRMHYAIDQMGAVNRAREQLQVELEHQAAHDPLTGLPNRAQALQLLRASLSRAERSGTSCAVLFIDLDGFKAVNDTHGHRAGDVVLRAVAQRMLGEVREGDSPCRLGGDEFVVVLEEIGSEASAVSIAERLIGSIGRPVELDEELEVSVGASIGVALGSSADTDPESLLHDADVAVYRAKARGKGRVELFDSTLRREFTHPSEMEDALAQAVRDDELVVRYQPVIATDSGDLLGFEALVRWDRPGVGLVPPSAFIPIAESSSLICDLDTWVLRTATRQLAQWNEQRGRDDLQVAVNISGRHISAPRICEDVADALRDSGLKPHQLTLEITETFLVDDRPALVNLRELSDLGVTISLDDFGTGYNSLARLASLPVDVVKIDKKYVDTGSAASRTLLELMVHAAHQFGLPVVGEGVERADQLALLRSVGCEMAQGYLLGRPQSPDELAHRIVAPAAADGAADFDTTDKIVQQSRR